MRLFYQRLLNCQQNLVQSRPLPFSTALWPPREPRRGPNQVGTGLQGDTALGLSVLQVLDTGEMAVRQGGVGQRPEMLGGLQLRRIRRQEQQVDMVGDAQLAAGMPPGAIQDEHDLLVWAGADLARELGQFHFEERNGDTRRQMKAGAPRGGMHKTDEIPPIVAVLDRSRWAHAVETPHLLEDRFQPDAVLIDRPELDARLGGRGRDRLDDRPQLFLNSVCCSGSAKTWRGRGLSRLPSRRAK